MAKGGEVIAIHAGEAGIVLGNTTWELYCMEHGIRRDGAICAEPDMQAINTLFSVTPGGKCVPRAIFIDTESRVLDDVRTGGFRYLFNPRNMISGKEDASNCFAKGYLTLGREMADAMLERIRHAAEECSMLQGFMVYRAVGGGTGSGFTCYILERLAQDYRKTTKLDICLYPAPKLSSVVVEPYNAALATHSSMSSVDCAFVYDNDAVYDICDRVLDISGLKFKNINRVISHVLSAVTSQFRFDGEVKVNLMDFQTNLVPYPRIHFPLIGYAPFARPDRVRSENYTVSSITTACFEPCNQMAKCNSLNGKYISCCLLYRGDVTPAEVNSTIATIKMKKTVKFVSWLPTKFKVGMNAAPPMSAPSGEIAPVNQACAMLGNNTAMQTVWERINTKFDLMYAKKAFIHWYVSEGLEESDFQETRMDMDALVADYKEVEAD